MPLQNRVLPTGEIVAVPARGTMMGNRGGRIHDPKTKSLTGRISASKRWICCMTEFKDRQRKVMGHSYTELFFLDEVTALACGHRPCYECRRASANAFALIWQRVFGKIEGSVADEMDKVLHRARLPFDNRADVLISSLPDGAMFRICDDLFAMRGGKALRWSLEGYARVETSLPKRALLITPAPVVAVLEAGFEPVWYKCAA